MKNRNMVGVRNKSTVERTRILSVISDELNKDLKPKEIAKNLDMPLHAVYKYINNLEELSIANLSPKVLGKRRKEIDMEYLLAIEEAKEMFYRFKDDEVNEEGEVTKEADPVAARKYHERWVDTLRKRAKLYGFDNVKVENSQYNQYNVQSNQYDLSQDQIDSIADALERGK